MHKRTLTALCCSALLCLACYLFTSFENYTSYEEEVPRSDRAKIYYEEKNGELNATIHWQGKTTHLCLADQAELVEDKAIFLSLLQKPGKTPDAFEAYYNMAYQMYIYYLEPILMELKHPPEELLITPSPSLSNIPFEVFRAKPYQVGDTVATSYLGQRYRIHYEYPTTSLTSSDQNKSQPSSVFLGIAPNFADKQQLFQQKRQHQLGPLYFHKKEVAYIEKLIGQNAKVSRDTTRAGLLRDAMRYKILHLATHSAIDPVCPEESSIFLSDTTITVQDLEGKRFTGEMAVLSSCFSGYQLTTAKGTSLSLAKAFQNAGWKSTVSCLWALDDWAAYYIMTQFYQYLKQGYTKDYALQQAKAAYLKESDLLHQHPYYWAGLVLHGDNTPIILESRVFFQWWFLSSILPLLSILVFSQKVRITFFSPRD